ncbi:THAP domain-containing protein 6-like [Penaeus monodon]|uniref:THAP domain-containing protein 6-like n=1 Tax=Penaeus monodon TaxID=6687 RepID=UPI0018A70051|nr:THAP domain-containing protein 6-like [Penaeus monodon]
MKPSGTNANMAKRGTQCCAFGCSKRRKYGNETEIFRSDSEGSDDDESMIKRNFPRTFHGFPSNTEKRKQWLVQMHREDWSPTSHSKICSDHFLEDDIDRTGQIVRLKAIAVPKRFKKFPKHLQKGIKKRKSPKKRQSREVSSSEQQIEEKDLQIMPVKNQPCEHHYFVADSPKKLKQKLNRSNEKMSVTEKAEMFTTGNTPFKTQSRLFKQCH